MNIIYKLSYVISAIFICLGSNKLWFYKNSELFPESNINAYVGGDAYNYIINASQASAYFTLALIFVIIGSTLLISLRIENSIVKKIENSTDVNSMENIEL